MDEASYVRPYTVTGGRTRPKSEMLPIEALVRAVGRKSHALNPEKRQIIELATGQYLSIAELSAHLHLPVGVLRVLVGDLMDEQYIQVHGLAAAESSYTPATTLSVLESVLNGISAL
jgi:DNA-directed RNA polymerase specialized sigma24 family protein